MTMTMFGAPSGAVARGGHQLSDPANVRPIRPWNPAYGAVSSSAPVSSGDAPAWSPAADSFSSAMPTHYHDLAAASGSAPWAALGSAAPELDGLVHECDRGGRARDADDRPRVGDAPVGRALGDVQRR